MLFTSVVSAAWYMASIRRISNLTKVRAFKVAVGTWFWWRVSLTMEAVRQ